MWDGYKNGVWHHDPRSTTTQGTRPAILCEHIEAYPRGRHLLPHFKHLESRLQSWKTRGTSATPYTAALQLGTRKRFNLSSDT